MRLLEYNEMMSILFFSQPPVALEPGKGGSTLSYQPSAELLQKTFDRMEMTSFCASRCNGSTI
jgi:hypothetical protein